MRIRRCSGSRPAAISRRSSSTLHGLSGWRCSMAAGERGMSACPATIGVLGYVVQSSPLVVSRLARIRREAQRHTDSRAAPSATKKKR